MPQVAKLSVDSMKVYADKLEALAQGQPNHFKAMALIAKGGVYMNKGQYELGHKTFENALRLLAHSQADTLRARALLGIGNYYKNTGDNPKALENLLAAQQIFEIRKNKSGIASSNSNLGQVYMQKNDMALAKEHLRKAMDVYARQKWQNPYLTAAHTLANVYGISGEFGQALKIDNEAIRIADSIASPKLKVPFLDNKAMCYMYSGRLDSAEFYFNETLKIDLMVGDEKQVADSYSNLSRLELMKGNYAASEKYALKSVDMLKSVHNNNNLVKSYAVLAELYTAWGKYPQAIKAKDDYVELYKKLMNEKREEAMAEFKIVHETEKKEKIIAQNHIELLKKEQEVNNRNNLIAGISLAAIFIAFAGFLIYRQQRVVNRQQAQEHELKTAIAQIETQNKLQEQRLDISRDLHDNIGSQLTFIISSVDNLKYAFDLKDSKLAGKLESISDFTRGTILELRDTIWAMNTKEITFEDVLVRISNFIEKAKDAKANMEFVIFIDDDLNPFGLSSVNGMHIYRTVQEAVNNAIKYSQASQVNIGVRGDHTQIEIRISDNGRGFDIRNVSLGNGLHNMEKRIEEVGGVFSLDSTAGEGTVVEILIPKRHLV